MYFFKMPLDDGPFPCGRTYIYIVRNEDADQFPLQHIFLLYSTAVDVAIDLARSEKKKYHIDIYEEAYNHRQLKYGQTMYMNDDLDTMHSRAL